MAVLQQQRSLFERTVRPYSTVTLKFNCVRLQHRCAGRLQTLQTHVASVNAAELKSDTRGSPPAAAEQATDASAQGQLEQLGNFNWLSFWYPVHTLESVDPSRPHAIELLGKHLVLWRDGQGKWQCMEDVCPHRLAPLSEGRIESDGTLQCSYHGWRFNSQGKCIEIPQALDDKAKAVACSSSRSCITRYPVKEECGLIWVWPTSGPAAEAAAAAEPIPLSSGGVAAYNAGIGGSWYRRELPYSWDILVENLTDPSHLPFSHHNLSPNLKREKGSTPMPFKPVDVQAVCATPADADQLPSYTMAHRPPVAAFDFPSALSPGGRVCYTPPLNVSYEYDIGPGVRMQNDLIAVPAGPGRSVAYTFGFSNAARVKRLDILKALFTKPKMVPVLAFRYAFQNAPHYQSHLQMNKLFDQDNLFLNMQDKQLARRGRSSWVQDYYMPAPCDGLVIAGRRWAEQALQLPLPTTSSQTGQKPPPAMEVIALSQEAATAAQQSSQRQVSDRYKQHTQHCVVCQKALQEIRKKVAAAKTASTVLLAAAVGVAAGLVVPQLVQLGGAVVAANGVGGDVVSGLNVVVGFVVAVVLGVGARIASAVAAAAEKQIAQFEYVEFSHATNH